MRNLVILPLFILFPVQTLVSQPESIPLPQGRFHLKQEVAPEYVDDEIVLKAGKKLELSSNTLADTPRNSDLHKLFERYCITKIQPVEFKSKTKIPHLYRLSIDLETLAQKKQQERAMRIRRLPDTDNDQEKQAIEEELDKQYSLPSIGEALTANSLIEYAEPHYFISLPHAPYYDTTSTGGQSPSTHPISQEAGNDPNSPPKHKGGNGPNDPYLTDQWYLQKINAEKAWEIQTGSPDVRVAVISSGVDYTHEDLEGSIDLESGYDFVSYDGASVEGEDYGPRDGDPMDFGGIGTHAAGIIAATNDNGIGICGIAPNVTIGPLAGCLC